MKKITSSILGLIIFLSLGIVHTTVSSSAPQSANNISTKSGSNEIALMPFLIGKLESPDNPIEKPLNLPIPQIVRDTQGVKDGSDLVMTRITHSQLNKRIPGRVVPLGISIEAYEIIKKDQTLDTPRKLAVRLGQELGADRVFLGTVWRFRERGSAELASVKPASVAFGLYLIDVSTGARLWRGAFEGSQKALLEDVIGGMNQVKMGLRWLSSEELALYGVKQALRKLPEV